MDNTKQQVREFYDQIGWSHAGDGLYQNARYEDLRPVSRQYIQTPYAEAHLAQKATFCSTRGRALCSGPSI
jgi:hypothetical protein